MRDANAIRAEIDTLRDAAAKTYAGEVRGAILRRVAELEEAATLLEHGSDKPSADERPCATT